MGRGLELMIDTMPKLKNYVLVIIGYGDVFEQLKRQVTLLGLETKVIFMGKILPEELPAYTESADIGISLEENLGLSYRYALPNKIFDYIQARLPVLASDLPLYNQLVKDFKIGEILEKRNPDSLAFLIEKIYANKESYKESLNKAADQFNWNIEKKKLIKFIKNIK
jgi:glycosyltransferase involved in cell wall biosynthesis